MVKTNLLNKIVVKKVLIGAAAAVVLLAGTYGWLNHECAAATAKAGQVAGAIESRTHTFEWRLQEGSLDVQQERAYLTSMKREYLNLPNWAVRPHAKSSFHQAVEEAEARLAAVESYSIVQR